MPKKGATNHRDIVGQPFGDLVVTARVGTKEYGKKRGKKCPVFRLVCSRGHWEDRSGNSLRATGDATQCKVCRRMRLDANWSPHVSRVSTS